MRVALITGVSGQDGSYLAEFLLAKGYKVIGVHRYTLTQNFNPVVHFKNISGIIEHDHFVLQYADMLDPSSLWKVVHMYMPDEVYNLASQSHVNLSFKSSEITCQVNGMGTLHLLNILAELVPNVRFFQASSSDMFGENPDPVLSEKSGFLPNTPYGASKLFAHNIVHTYKKAHKLFAVNGICFNHESPRRSDNFATQKIAKTVVRIKTGEESYIALGNIDVIRDWGHSKDFVEAMWLMLQQENPEDYVIATGIGNSLRNFVESIFNVADLDMHAYLKIEPKLFRSYEKEKIVGDPTMIQKKLKWHHQVDFDQLAVEMYQSALNEIDQ